MATRERMEAWLAAFAAQHEGKLELSEDGWCAFSVDDVHCDLFFSPEVPMYRLIAALMPAPEDNEEGVLRWLLEENFTQSLFRGVSFAIDRENSEVVLLFDHVITEQDTAEAFLNIMERFISIAEKIPRQIVSWVDENAPNDESSELKEPSPSASGFV